jgi:hypothetical protein
LAVLLSACGGHKAGTVPTPEQIENLPLSTTALAGQTISVVPLSLLAADSLSGAEAPLSDHPRALQWVDSVLGRMLTERAPEVDWKLPPELRKIARRAAGIAPDPDRMGQGMMRDPSLRIVPDPFRAALRTLTALAGGRFALVPAVAVFFREKDGATTAEVVIVLCDSRDAVVDWRTRAVGHGASPSAALGDALDHVLPLLEGK